VTRCAAHGERLPRVSRSETERRALIGQADPLDPDQTYTVRTQAAGTYEWAQYARGVADRRRDWLN
jgi:hypothetical protein